MIMQAVMGSMLKGNIRIRVNAEEAVYVRLRMENLHEWVQECPLILRDGIIMPCKIYNNKPSISSFIGKFNMGNLIGTDVKHSVVQCVNTNEDWGDHCNSPYSSYSKAAPGGA